jgi:hypothetical protein
MSFDHNPIHTPEQVAAERRALQRVICDNENSYPDIPQTTRVKLLEGNAARIFQLT